MAKDQQIGLLSDIVGQLRQLNRSSVRDKLQENEQTKRTAKLAEVVEDSTVENTGLISSAQDFQRRFMAGQARTEFNAAIKDKKSTLAGQELLLKSSDWQSDILRDISEHSSLGTEVGVSRLIMLEGIYDILENQYDMWKGLLAGQKTQLAFDQKIHKIDDRRYMNGLRNANEKRLEGITGGVGGAALGTGRFFEGIGDSDEEVDTGLSTTEAVVAGGLGMWILGKIKAVGAWFGKGIKWGKGLLGRFAAIGLALFSKNPKQRRVLGPAQKKMAKNPRMWPILLATLVAANMFDGFMGVSDEFAMDSKETAGSGASSERSMLSSIGSFALDALNIALWFPVADFVTKKILGTSLTAMARIAWGAMKNARLGQALLYALGAGGAVLSAPVWGAIIVAGITAYFWEDISNAMHKAYEVHNGDIKPDATKTEIKSRLVDDIIGNTAFKPFGKDTGMPDWQRMKDQQTKDIVAYFVKAKDNLTAVRAFYDSLIINGFTHGQIAEYMNMAGVKLEADVVSKSKQRTLLKSLEGKVDPGLLRALETNKQLASLAAAAKKADKIKQKRIKIAAQNDNTPDGPFPSFGTIPYEFRQSKNGGVGTPEMTDHINSLISPANGTNVINTDASNNSSTVNIIYQDHILKDYSGMNSYTNTSGEKWSW